MRKYHLIFICAIGVWIGLLVTNISLSFQINNGLSINNKRPISNITNISQPTLSEAKPQEFTSSSYKINITTPTSTPVPANICAVKFVDEVIDNQSVIPVTGKIGAIVTLTDLTTGEILTNPSVIKQSTHEHSCEGFIELTLIHGVSLASNHLVIIESDDGTYDATIVQSGHKEPTPTPSATPTATNIVSENFLFLEETCGFAPHIQFTVWGFNWKTSETIALYWDGHFYDLVQSGHDGSFHRSFTQLNTSNGVYELVAISASNSSVIEFEIPCPNVTATPATN